MLPEKAVSLLNLSLAKKPFEFNSELKKVLVTIFSVVTRYYFLHEKLVKLLYLRVTCFVTLCNALVHLHAQLNPIKAIV